MYVFGFGVVFGFGFYFCVLFALGLEEGGGRSWILGLIRMFLLWRDYFLIIESAESENWVFLDIFL